MEEAVERPEIVTDKMLLYLDNLRESGITNMFSASSYVEKKFSLSHKDAKDALLYWMKSFSQRYPE